MPNPALHPSYGLLTTAQAEATQSRKYDSEVTRASISQKFTDAFDSKHAYEWQIDTCEALLLGLDAIVIAGTGAGKTYLFAMPLLMDQTCRKIVIVVGFDFPPYVLLFLKWKVFVSLLSPSEWTRPLAKLLLDTTLNTKYSISAISEGHCKGQCWLMLTLRFPHPTTIMNHARLPSPPASNCGRRVA
jgi:hypothetical protein